jgi:2-phosphoglycerate kinase
MPAEDHRSGAGRPAPSREAIRETVVVHKGHGLPYSKGLMAQALSATALSQERSFELARLIESRLAERGQPEIDLAALHALAEEVLLAEEGELAAGRYRGWRRLDRLDRPLVVLIGGTTGVGKSTLATMLAARLGVNRVIATDVIRQVLRAFFTHEAMPTVHYSAFEAGGIAGYRDQAERVGTGIAAIVDRAANEAKPMVVEGVHVVPGGIHPRVRERCVLVEALVVVDDPDLHRGHFSLRPGTRPAERYLESFDDIRRLQDHLWERALSERVAVVDNENVDGALARLMELVLDAVRQDVK